MAATMQDPGGCNCSCAFTLRVVACSQPASGVTVAARATSSGPVLATGVTNSSGDVALLLPAAGNYLFTASGDPAFGASSSTLSVTCGGSGTLTIPSTSMLSGWCCGTNCPDGSVAFPSHLFLTDAIGTLSFTMNCTSGAIVGRNLPVADVMTCPSNTTDPCTVAAGITRVNYLIAVEPSGQLSVRRTWLPVGCSTPGSGLGTHYNNATPPVGSGTCPFVGFGLFDFSQVISAVVSCRSFYWSGTPVPAGTNVLADPIGGSVVISS